MMEDLDDLEQEDMKALGLRIEKCVDEVLRSHLVERPRNTTKNYIPKQKEWKVNQAPPLQPFTNVHRLHHRPGVRRSAFALATPRYLPYDWVDEGKLLLFATERVVNRTPRTGPRLVAKRKRKRG